MTIQFPAGGFILGLGIDIIGVERVKGVHKRFGDRFLAKEVVSKVFTTGIGKYLKWTSVSVYNGERMEPLVRRDSQARALLKKAGGISVLISLANINIYANAITEVVRGDHSIEGI